MHSESALLAQEIQSPNFVCISYELFISVHDSADSITFNLAVKHIQRRWSVKFLLLSLREFPCVGIEWGSDGTIPVVPDVLYVWSIHCIPCFPGPVYLVRLLPKKDVFKLFVIASIQYVMSVTKIETSAVNACFKGPWNQKMIPVNCTRTWNVASSIFSKLKVSQTRSWSNCKYVITDAILYRFCFIAMRISCEHREFTCVAAMELIN